MKYSPDEIEFFDNTMEKLEEAREKLNMSVALLALSLGISESTCKRLLYGECRKLDVMLFMRMKVIIDEANDRKLNPDYVNIITLINSLTDEQLKTLSDVATIMDKANKQNNSEKNNDKK